MRKRGEKMILKQMKKFTEEKQIAPDAILHIQPAKIKTSMPYLYF